LEIESDCDLEECDLEECDLEEREKFYFANKQAFAARIHSRYLSSDQNRNLIYCKKVGAWYTAPSNAPLPPNDANIKKQELQVLKSFVPRMIKFSPELGMHTPPIPTCVYKVNKKTLLQLNGGAGHNGGTYGEHTQSSMQCIINALVDFECLNKDSRFLDLGCGLNSPAIHVAQSVGCYCAGIEVCEVRTYLATSNFMKMLEDSSNDGKLINHRVAILCLDIKELGNINFADFIYMFDQA
jgi:Histone methylation protein DOT1